MYRDLDIYWEKLQRFVKEGYTSSHLELMRDHLEERPIRD